MGASSTYRLLEQASAIVSPAINREAKHKHREILCRFWIGNTGDAVAQQGSNLPPAEDFLL